MDNTKINTSLDLYLPLDNGKYIIKREKETNDFYAERYGEKWRSLNGDNLIYWLCVELEQSREQVKRQQLATDWFEQELVDQYACVGKAGSDIANSSQGIAITNLLEEVIEKFKEVKNV